MSSTGLPSASHAPSAAMPPPTVTAIAAAPRTKDRRLIRPSQSPVTPKRPASSWLDVLSEGKIYQLTSIALLHGLEFVVKGEFLLSRLYHQRVLAVRRGFD